MYLNNQKNMCLYGYEKSDNEYALAGDADGSASARVGHGADRSGQDPDGCGR